VAGDALAEASLTRARAGDEEAFRTLTEPHRRELQLHCYRIPRLGAGRRGHGAGDAPGRLAEPRGVRGSRLRALLALPDRDQPLPERAARAVAPPQGGTSHWSLAGAHAPNRAGLARAIPPRAARGHPRPLRRAGGALRSQGVDRAFVHRRPPAPAAPPARGARARASAPPRLPRCSTPARSR
jgi:hypothetical protein